ncbi:hypothetical protein D3C73_988260 [compost metagenome]
MEIASMFSFKFKNSLTNSIELSRPTVKSGEPTTVKLSVYGNVYGADGVDTDLLNGIVKVKLSGYGVSDTVSSGRFGDVELPATGTTVIDVQFHDGIAEIPLTLTVPGKQKLFIEIVDLKNSLRSVEIEVLPIDLNDVLLFHTPIINEVPIQMVAYRHDQLLRWLI